MRLLSSVCSPRLRYEDSHYFVWSKGCAAKLVNTRSPYLDSRLTYCMLLPWKRPLHCYCLSTDLVIPHTLQKTLPKPERLLLLLLTSHIQESPNVSLRMSTANQMHYLSARITRSIWRGKKESCRLESLQSHRASISDLPAQEDMSRMRIVYKFCC